MDTQTIVTTREQMGRIIDEIMRDLNHPQGPDGRREQCRLTYVAPGTVTISDESQSTAEPMYITTRDISIDGLGFLLHKDMPRGLKVTVVLDISADRQIEFAATVAHSTPTVSADTYKIGVLFDFTDGN